MNGIIVNPESELCGQCAELEAACLQTAWSRESIEHRGELCTYLVYVVDDAVAGICSYYDVGGERQLINIAVAEKYRRRGIGSALLRRMLADGSCASLEVETGNTEAIRLYEKMGFKKAGIRRHFYGRADAYIMLGD